MRQLGECEVFKKSLSQSQMNDITMAIKQKLSTTTAGTISPKNIEAELTQLKIKSKNSSSNLINPSIAFFEGYNGKIRLFNLGTSSSGRSPIPTSMPFTITKTRHRPGENSNPTAEKETIFMNMYRIGNWSSNTEIYSGFSPLTDLYTILESGFISYKLLMEGRADKIFSNKTILETITRIYTWLFNKAMIKSATVYSNDFNTSAAQFLIAKFFLRYVLKKQETDTLNDFAYEGTDGRTSIRALVDFENNADIDYSSLSAFLKTFGKTIYGNDIVSLPQFQLAWVSLFGEGTMFSIEFLPYLIHFLLGVVHGSSLGGASRLMLYKPDLTKKGLEIFYRNLVSEMS